MLTVQEGGRLCLIIRRDKGAHARFSASIHEWECVSRAMPMKHFAMMRPMEDTKPARVPGNAVVKVLHLPLCHLSKDTIAQSGITTRIGLVLQAT